MHECVQPFQSLAYPLEPEELLEIARFHARKAWVHIQGLVGTHELELPPFPLPLSPVAVQQVASYIITHFTCSLSQQVLGLLASCSR